MKEDSLGTGLCYNKPGGSGPPIRVSQRIKHWKEGGLFWGENFTVLVGFAQTFSEIFGQALEVWDTFCNNT